MLSLLEKNRDGIALRPGLQGDYVEARRLLTERQSVGRLGVENRAFAISEWLAMLDEAGWKRDDWVGIRLFSDHAPDDLSADAYAALVALERAAGATHSYRQVSRLVHLEGDDARSGRRESAGVEVERPQVVVEVDMQPLAPGGAGLVDGNGDQIGADPSAPGSLRD